MVNKSDGHNVHIFSLCIMESQWSLEQAYSFRFVGITQLTTL